MATAQRGTEAEFQLFLLDLDRKRLLNDAPGPHATRPLRTSPQTSNQTTTFVTLGPTRAGGDRTGRSRTES